MGNCISDICSSLFAINWINQVHLLLSRPVEFLLEGDTVDDFEVASELGCACILVSNGHQSYERLKSTGVLVIEDLAQLMSGKWLRFCGMQSDLK